MPDLGPAPELRGVDPWLNAPRGEPPMIELLSGRVVLIEFWAFACGNCQRTLPFLRRMHSRYEPALQVLGVHTPELPVERPTPNVARAVHQEGLAFPIGLDNDYSAWNAYGNRYWPSLYLVDAEGRLRYSHVGEGDYVRIEAAACALMADGQG